VELQATSQRITEIHDAEVPKTKNTRSQIVRAAETGFWGFLLGVVGAVAVVGQEHLTRRLGGRNNLPQPPA
jgi:hypothetical protein